MYIPKAFEHGNEIILDCEVLMYDQKIKKPLPFGTLGIHKVLFFQLQLINLLLLLFLS